MEENLFKVNKVLDHGFVRVIDYMGDDAAIVQAARVSYGQGTKKSRDDTGLINYLMVVQTEQASLSSKPTTPLTQLTKAIKETAEQNNHHLEWQLTAH